MNSLRVMLVDDHAVLRAGLQLLINGQPDMAVVAEAGTMAEALTVLGQAAPDVVVMDMSLPDGDGVQLTEQILRLRPEQRILGLTWHKDQGYLTRLMAAGARGYVVKQSAADSLLSAIRLVAAGERYLDPSAFNAEPPPALNGAAVPKAAPVETASADLLTAEEVAVLRHVVQGYTSREIAEQLDMPTERVSEHKAQAMQKLNLRSRIDLLRYAEAQSWLRDR